MLSQKSSLRIRTFAFLAGSLLVAATLSHAAEAQLPSSEPILVNVQVEAKPEPKKAVGMILSAGETVEIQDATIKKVGEKMYSISFLVDRSLVRNDTVATAMVFDEQGHTSFANVTPEIAAEAHNAIARIPECPTEDPATIVQLDQHGPLQQLVDVRTERAELARLKLSRLLDENFLAKLARFEEAFGLQKGDEISANIPPDVLVDRLSRITHSVKKYRMFKKQAPVQQNPGS
jgi:hypothetical protein